VVVLLINNYGFGDWEQEKKNREERRKNTGWRGDGWAAGCR
jgi:hypothetical protein